ncbi:glycerol kinase [Nonomuraea phyllanthi]|uniref:ATP:glycerol 3-phosphotransferase n=1 Tax=Nonomuraea phyllanthi TaxID=2219224 RepID=A0A5C4WS00_9ACTN|nr:FGGY family carbohydrate kinase [Nonomuraea phyllanthi]KAB8196008.1 glycerol kinase [Nonomuraea phyllanthi]QFY07463.1 glycerol kinase [Nonomuraea phyllanthi]
MTRAEPLVLGVDQGTSATKAILVDAGGEPVASATAPLPVRHPAPGRVEQDGEELWRSVREAVSRCLAGVPPGRVAAVGLSVQRESLILWDRDTGEPLGPLVSWQDRRGTDLCARLAADGAAPLVRRISGLPLDPMFSASRAAWLLARHRARDGLCLGTVDSWLLFKMGGGHVVEVGSASRTQLLDVRRRRWSGELLDLFGIPAGTLPRVVPSSGAHADAAALHPSLAGVPVGAVLGDSHAALFAHAAGEPGRVKVTYGTGSSVMGLTGHAEPDAPGLDAPSGGPDAPSGDGLCLTIGWDDGRPAYALEGNILSAGATVTWLAGLLATEPAEVARLATLGRRGRLHIVPAFGGLGAPWWDDRAQAIMTGLGLDSRREDLARAAVDSIGLQVGDVVSAMEHAAGPVTELLADGGPTANADLMQWQADVTGLPVRVARRPELSALGVAHLAGTASGVWSRRELSGLPRHGRRYTPGLSSRERHRALAEWHSAVARARHRTSRSGGAEAEASDRGS